MKLASWGVMEETYLDAFAFDDWLPPLPQMVQSREVKPSKEVQHIRKMRSDREAAPPSSPSSVLLRIASNASELAGENGVKGEASGPKVRSAGHASRTKQQCTQNLTESQHIVDEG